MAWNLPKTLSFFLPWEKENEIPFRYKKKRRGYSIWLVRRENRHHVQWTTKWWNLKNSNSQCWTTSGSRIDAIAPTTTLPRLTGRENCLLSSANLPQVQTKAELSTTLGSTPHTDTVPICGSVASAWAQHTVALHWSSSAAKVMRNVLINVMCGCSKYLRWWQSFLQVIFLLQNADSWYVLNWISIYGTNKWTVWGMPIKESWSKWAINLYSISKTLAEFECGFLSAYLSI